MKKTGIVFLTLVLLAGLAAAQTAPTGKLVGKVKDNQNIALPGVTVEAVSPKMVGKATAVTDDTGAYRLFSLPSGSYTVTFTLQGFKTYKRENIILQLEQTLNLDATLEQGAIAEEITVVGQSPLIDVKSTTKGSTMTKDVFMQLPRNRDYTGLLSTVPGVQYEDVQGGLTVDGASGSENVWFIDGTNTSHMNYGLQYQSIVMEQVEEVKVTASGYGAEFGGSLGGVVNVISRSGGNEFHGDVYGYYNNNRLWMEGKARDFLRFNPYNQYEPQYANNDNIYFNGGKDRDDYQRFEGVFSLGGFIVKDKLWFFGSFNPVYYRTYADRFFTTDPTDQTKAKYWGDTARDPRQGRPVYEFYQKYYYWNWQFKLTSQPLKGMRASISAVNNFYNYRGTIPSTAGTQAKNNPWIASWDNTIIKGTDPGLDYPNWSANATMDYTVSNNFLFGIRVGYNFNDQRNQQIKMPGTQYSFSYANTDTAKFPDIPDDLRHFAGWSNWAGSNSEMKSYVLERTSVNTDFTYYMNLAGEHAWKFGLQYVHNHEDVNNATQHPIVYLNWGIGYPMPDGRVIQGKYGYYAVRSDWKSPYGERWDATSTQWAIYLQDSWTITDKLTLNFGARTESEYIPTFNPDTTLPGWTDKPIKFGFLFKGKFWEKFAPRFGLVYDVFGDSSLKVFGSYGVYYDVMKLWVAVGMTGGRKWWDSYYALETYDWPKIAASGDITNQADQGLGGAYGGSRNWRYVDFNLIDTGMKPMAQSETSFGAEKKISEEISVSARLVYKHLYRGIEDIGIMVQDAQGNFSEAYIEGNPGFGFARPKSQGGKMVDEYWPTPKAKREYWGLNLALEKRFSNNWQGGVNYTWSRLYGNYGGLASSDEAGRSTPNRDRYYDMWFERYQINGVPLDGVLPSDRTHFFKVYGSYAFPFGLTVGMTAFGRSGFPRNTSLAFNDMTILPNGYNDLGRLPFTAWANIYLEYSLRIAKKYSVALNLQVNNVTDAKTIQGYNDRANRTTMRALPAELLTKTYDWKANLSRFWPNEQWGMWTSRFAPWNARVGARFSF